MRASSTPARRAAAAIHFRNEIEKAEAAGASRDDMLLHLTLSDVSQIKRDRSLALTDINFAGETMRFLGVKVEQGGVTESVLIRPT
ncbi:hypothetical protein LJR225_000630 [Phenylobacterium sp. LjRoot225]|uniref:hypothetical protein n=1 Tax=Phenylobacterium sp. LjRoot225 TaxID=3342285 RepID=UPI003ECDA1F1